MAFTYNLNHADAEKRTISRIRLNINDKVRDAGPLPNGTNFQDEEIGQLYSDEGSHVMRAVAAALEVLAAAWAGHAGTYRLGPESEEAKQAEVYQKQAEVLRGRYGWPEDDEADAQRAAFVAEVRPAGQA